MEPKNNALSWKYGLRSVCKLGAMQRFKFTIPIGAKERGDLQYLMPWGERLGEDHFSSFEQRRAYPCLEW